MTSESKFKTILVIFVALLVLGGAGIFLAYRFWPTNTTSNLNNAGVVNQPTNTNVVVDQNTNQTPTNENINGGVNENTNVSVPGIPQPDEVLILALGRSFTERYGSFSNQNNFENLQRLLVYMTPKLKQSTQAYISSEQIQQSSKDPYYGVTTDVATISIDKLEGGRAVVVVNTRRRTSAEGKDAIVTTQSGKIVLLKTNGEWLVDKFDWQ